MSELYLARQRGLGGFERTLVLKILQDRYAQNSRIVTMFLSEARLAAKLNHSSIVHVYDAPEEDGGKYIAMEYIHGETLTDIIKRGVEVGSFLPIEHALHIVSQIADGLDYAHGRRDQARIAHCDISPSNIMVSYEGQPKIIDFGIARVEAQIRETWGMRSGKASYMSPEQVLGTAVDHRSDIFSLGIILYEITSAHRLWRGPSEVVKQRIVSEAIPPPTTVRPDYPRALEQIVMRALEKRPEDRYQVADEMRHDLEELAVAAGYRSGSRRLSIYLRELFPLRASRPDGVVEEPRLADSADSIPLPSVSRLVPSEEDTDPTSPALSESRHAFPGVEAMAAQGVPSATPSSRRPSKPKLVLGVAAITFCSLTAVAMYWRPRSAKTAGSNDLPDHTRSAEERRPSASRIALVPIDPVDEKPSATITVDPLPLPDPQAVPAPTRALGPWHKTATTSHPIRPHSPQHLALTTEWSGPASQTDPSPVAEPAPTKVPELREAPAPIEVPSPRPTVRPAVPIARAPITSSVPVTAPTRPPGFIDAKAVTALVRKHAAEVQECFDRAVMEHADLHGRFTVRATIDPKGHVLAASSTTILDGGGRLQICVVGAFERWTFPQPIGGVEGTVTYAFSFE
jgi:serine/threonine protein kinase